MSRHVEGRLEFEFQEPPWQARKWDDTPSYRNHIGKLTGTKATDFVAWRDSNVLFIEVKDFRGHRIENKARLSDGELALEVAQKVRDTLAGIIGAHRMAGDGADWTVPVGSTANVKHGVQVVLWLEQDAPPKAPRGTLDRTRNTLEQLLKQQLRWLTTKVLVTSLEQSKGLAGIKVRNIAK